MAKESSPRYMPERVPRRDIASMTMPNTRPWTRVVRTRQTQTRTCSGTTVSGSPSPVNEPLTQRRDHRSTRRALPLSRWPSLVVLVNRR